MCRLRWLTFLAHPVQLKCTTGHPRFQIYKYATALCWMKIQKKNSRGDCTQAPPTLLSQICPPMLKPDRPLWIAVYLVQTYLNALSSSTCIIEVLGLTASADIFRSICMFQMFRYYWMLTIITRTSRDIVSPLAHPTMTIFELGLPFEPRMMLIKISWWYL